MVPVKNNLPRHFLLINTKDKKASIQVFYGAAATLRVTLVAVAGLLALSM